MVDRYVVVVGEGDAVDDAERSLSADFEIRRCPGYMDGNCPAMHRDRCELTAEADAAVVFFAGEHEFHAPGRWMCLDSAPRPAVAVIEGSPMPARGSDGFVVVGDRSGSDAVREAVHRAVTSAP
ncbi:MAG TPA: hypothetical protein VFK89_04515 [Actinomycetota bacterium]|nr:hypothetical protein [Actinomycetota bacterium]